MEFIKQQIDDAHPCQRIRGWTSTARKERRLGCWLFSGDETRLKGSAAEPLWAGWLGPSVPSPHMQHGGTFGLFVDHSMVAAAWQKQWGAVGGCGPEQLAHTYFTYHPASRAATGANGRRNAAPWPEAELWQKQSYNRHLWFWEERSNRKKRHQ